MRDNFRRRKTCLQWNRNQQKRKERKKNNFYVASYVAETKPLLAMSSAFFFCRWKKLLADIVNYTFFLLIAQFSNATFIDFLSRSYILCFFFFILFAGKRCKTNVSGCKEEFYRLIGGEKLLMLEEFVFFLLEFIHDNNSWQTRHGEPFKLVQL